MRLNLKSRRRVVWVSVAPATIIIAVLAHTALSIVYDSGELVGGPFGYGAPFLWQRVEAVSQALMTLEIPALALLFAAGLQSWTRNEGAWMLLIGTVLLGVALVCGAFVVGAYAVLNRADVDDVRVHLWMNIAGSFALMAIGYFFLAYRGASEPARPPRKMPEPHR